jgi:hypothetical protein
LVFRGHVWRFVVLNVLEELGKTVDVIVHRRFVILPERVELEVGADIFDVEDLSVLFLESIPDRWGAVLYCTDFEEFG